MAFFSVNCAHSPSNPTGRGGQQSKTVLGKEQSRVCGRAPRRLRADPREPSTTGLRERQKSPLQGAPSPLSDFPGTRRTAHAALRGSYYCECECEWESPEGYRDAPTRVLLARQRKDSVITQRRARRPHPAAVCGLGEERGVKLLEHNRSQWGARAGATKLL